MKTARTEHLIERTYREDGTFQWVREVLRNAIKADATKVEFGIEWQADRYSSSRILDTDFRDRFAVIGPADYGAERIGELVDLGLDRIYIGTRKGTADLDERNTLRSGEQVLMLVRAAR